MSSHVHIALYDALREAGASEEKARAAAGAIPADEHLATKQDIAELKVSFYRAGEVATFYELSDILARPTRRARRRA